MERKRREEKGEEEKLKRDREEKSKEREGAAIDFIRTDSLTGQLCCIQYYF